MSSIKIFLKNFNVLNLLLSVMATFLFFQLDYSFAEKKDIFINGKQKELSTDDTEKTNNESAANYSDYNVIIEKNLFHPARRILSEAKQEQQTSRPEIILYGTLITDEKRIAYIEDKKNPYSTPGRGKRQVAINEGGMIAGYKLAKVNAESILLVHGEDKMTVTLSIQKERKPMETSGKITLPNDSSSGAVMQLQSRPTQPYMPPLPPLPRPVQNLKSDLP